MRSRVARRGPRMVVAAAAGVAVAAVLAAPAAAAVPRSSDPPAVEIQTHPGVLAPDGSTIGVVVSARCPDRWTLVEASVTVVQPQASGRGSFPLVCFGFMRSFHVTVPATSGSFVLGTADVSARVIATRGRTQQATASRTLDVHPGVAVDLAPSARLEPGGAAVGLAVTVACPLGAIGVESRLGVFQGQTSGIGLYTPVCDGAPHTFDVRVPATSGAYVLGIAQTLTFANVTYDGMAFYGIDDDGALEIVQ